MVLNSCVYSLFPIYTDDTLVFKEELLGKWATGDDPDEYILFERTGSNSDVESEYSKEKVHYADSVIGEDFVLRSEGRVSMLINGKKVFDKDSIRTEMEGIMKEIEDADSEKEIETEDDESTFPFGRNSDYDVSGYTSSEKSYKMTVSGEDKTEVYIAHLVEIDGDLFMDLFPAFEYSSNTFSENFFPVHTFLKIKVDGNMLDFTFFDLDKLNKLFESNLIRMRHEKVDGQILITAQPKEIQKFLGKYSDDESVFDSTERYLRIGS